MVSSFRYLEAVFLLGLWAFASGGLAFANDSSFGDSNGSIVLMEQSDISLEKESLFISESRVEVEYVFRNNATEDLTLPMAFPMPPMFFGPRDHNAITDFKLWVDGNAVKTTRTLVVLLDGRDITKELNQLGWGEKELVSLLTDGEAPETAQALPRRWFGKEGEPRFTLHEYFLWSQHFPAGQPLKIRHAYVPSISTGVPVPASAIIDSSEDEVCMDEAAKAGIRRRERGYGVAWAQLEYILVTANNWRGPIGEFHLTLRKAHPSDLISLCFDGKLRKTDPVTFEFHQKAFRPKQDLNILFVRYEF